MPIRRMAVVFRSVVEPDVQPGHAAAGGTEPDRDVARAAIHCTPNPVPQRALLVSRRPANKICKMRKRRVIDQSVVRRAGHHQLRIAAEILEFDDLALAGHAKMLGERRWIRRAFKIPAVANNALEWLVEIGSHHGRRFPAKSLPGRRGQRCDEGINKCRFVAPKAKYFTARQVAPIDCDVKVKRVVIEMSAFPFPHGC